MLDCEKYKRRIADIKRDCAGNPDKEKALLEYLRAEIKSNLYDEVLELRKSLPCNCTMVDLRETKFKNIIKPGIYDIGLLFAMLLEGLRKK